MFTGIVEELGTVVSREGPRLRIERHHRARRRRRWAPRSPSTAAASPSSPGRGRLVGGRRRRRDLRPHQPRRPRTPATRSTSSAPCGSATGSAATSCRATSTRSARSSTPAPDLRVARRAGPAPLRRREGLDHRRRHQPHRGRGRPTTASPSPSSRTPARSPPSAHKGPGDPVNLEVDVIAKYVESLLEGHRPERHGCLPTCPSPRIDEMPLGLRSRAGRDPRGGRRRGPRERGRPHHGGRARHAREGRVLPAPHLGLHLRPDHQRAGRRARPAARWSSTTPRAAHRVPRERRLPPRHRTGISAYDRSATVQALVDPATRPGDLARPGHILPLEAREGGVLKRAGHTEATDRPRPHGRPVPGRDPLRDRRRRQARHGPRCPSSSASPTSTAC